MARYRVVMEAAYVIEVTAASAIEAVAEAGTHAPEVVDWRPVEVEPR